MQKPNKTLVAATFEKTKTYVFAEPLIRDREVGGSDPLAPTKKIKHLRRSETVAAVRLWGKLRGLFQTPQDSPSLPSVLESADGCNAWPCERPTNP